MEHVPMFGSPLKPTDANRNEMGVMDLSFVNN